MLRPVEQGQQGRALAQYLAQALVVGFALLLRPPGIVDVGDGPRPPVDGPGRVALRKRPYQVPAVRARRRVAHPNRHFGVFARALAVLPAGHHRADVLGVHRRRPAIADGRGQGHAAVLTPVLVHVGHGAGAVAYPQGQRQVIGDELQLVDALLLG